ncbi:hypothetical protein LCGC14_1375430 [marine sediment metagenome]|uniref:Poly A polymerase head domain-containing protein n=1 Tax=marine sediment metagenome TaxID=412755 RepID=A0A0F9KQ39_9ZZZZ
MTPTQYIVGGAVRDVLLGNDPKDLDYVWVGATPEFLSSLGMSQVGADFPVFLDAVGNEHALARTERKVGEGYKGFEVQFDSSVTLKDDLVRRDLTINAMAVLSHDWDRFVETKDPECVFDPFGGLADLELKTLRHVSDAFAEDPVRVLRVARFAARYNFNIDPDTLNLMCALTQSGELDHLVPARVWSEMEKAMSEPFPGDFFLPLDLVGALRVLMPELDYGMLTEMNLASATLPTKSRFAALFANSTVADIEAMCDRLKAPSDVRRLAVRTRKLVMLCLFELSPSSVVNTLEQMGCFQDPNDTWDAIHVCDVLAQNTMTGFTSRLHSVRKLQGPLRDVCFASLTKDQQATLEGPAVGAAIRELRLKLVKDSL